MYFKGSYSSLQNVDIIQNGEFSKIDCKTQGALCEQVELPEKWVNERLEDGDHDEHEQSVAGLHLVRLDIYPELTAAQSTMFQYSYIAYA